MNKTAIPRLGETTVEPDKLAILEINEAFKDKSGKKAKDIIYDKEREWRKALKDMLR